MNRIKTVIFDMDGTILDTLGDLTDAINHSFESFGLGHRSLEQVRKCVGHGLRNLAIDLSEGQNVDVDSLVAAFTGFYAEHSDIRTCPYPGIPELISTLRRKGYRTAVVSNKADAVANVLAKKHFGDLLEVCVGASPEREIKPAPDGVQRALDLLGESAEDAVYIGDSEVDAETAANAGLPFIAVLWGFRDRDTLEQAGAKLIASVPDDIEKFLKQI